MHDETKFEYSEDALNIYNQFYDDKITFFVEGEDDILFWMSLLNLIVPKKVCVRNLYGREELEKRMDELIKSDDNYIILCDRDHTDYEKPMRSHARIVRTYGYSIENTMYCSRAIMVVIRKLAKIGSYDDGLINAWRRKFGEDSGDLVVYDIANMRFGKGISVFGDNCSRFLKSKHACVIDVEKVSLFIKKISNAFETEELEEVSGLLDKDKRDLWYKIKGHFLTNAVVNYIKSECRRIAGKTINLPLETVYALFIGHCEHCGALCEEAKVVIESLKRALASIGYTIA